MRLRRSAMVAWKWEARLKDNTMPIPTVEEIKGEFRMFVPDDDGSAMDWLENTLTTLNQKHAEELRQLQHDHEILVNTILETKKQELEKAVEELDNLANIYGWHHNNCAGYSHHPSCPVVKLRRMLLTPTKTDK